MKDSTAPFDRTSICSSYDMLLPPPMDAPIFSLEQHVTPLERGTVSNAPWLRQVPSQGRSTHSM
jgi:hypothetical protein